MSAPVPRRIVIVASASASGKTTLGRGLADALGLDFTELDGLVHGPGWCETPDAELRSRVAPLLARSGWVLDGSYQDKLGPLVLDAAELIVWLDLPMVVWLPRLLRRSTVRVLRRQELWNGNRETLRGVLGGRHSVVGHALRTAPARRRAWPKQLSGRPVVRLRSRAAVSAFTDALLRDAAHGIG